MNIIAKIKSVLSHLFGWLRHGTRTSRPSEGQVHKMLNTNIGGPNMPKHQPCPKHGGSRKRLEKTGNGAFYHCWCGDFFVRAPGF